MQRNTLFKLSGHQNSPAPLLHKVCFAGGSDDAHGTTARLLWTCQGKNAQLATEQKTSSDLTIMENAMTCTVTDAV